MHPWLLADPSGSSRLAPPRPWIPTVPSPPSNCCSTSLWAVRGRIQEPRNAFGGEAHAPMIENNPSGVGVLGLPTTTGTRRTRRRGDRPRATDRRLRPRSARRSDARSPGKRQPIRWRRWAAREGAPPPSIARCGCGRHRAPATTTPAPVRRRSGPSCLRARHHHEHPSVREAPRATPPCSWVDR